MITVSLPKASALVQSLLHDLRRGSCRPFPLARRTLGETVYAALSELLASGQLGPGERLSLRDSAAALGVDVQRTRLLLVLGAVALAAFATATTGPIAFVAFLAGPIAVRLVGPGGSLVIPAALVGAALVLAADVLGQFAFDTRFPVGVVTGAVGAPYLLYLLIRSNRTGGAL